MYTRGRAGGLVSDAVIDGSRDIRRGGRRPSRTGNVSVSKKFREGTPDRFSKEEYQNGLDRGRVPKGTRSYSGYDVET